MYAEKYIRRIKNIFVISFATCLSLCGLYACASFGTPGGGELDTDPPRYVGSTPSPNALNFSKNKVEIVFDELVAIEKASEKVIITPPQQQNPIIKSQGKKVIVELKDSLLPNTTYTIDFTDAIVDNNEKNPLENYSFAFSTGNVLDSLMVSGRLLNAENLEPMPNILVGLHRDLNDSAFISKSFVRTSKTNDKGQFSIRNITPGTYKIYALEEVDRSYTYNQPGEAIAFNDSLIVPDFEFAVRNDTTWTDTTKVEIDTIREIHYTHFFPDDIILRLFKEKKEKQSMSRPERPNMNRFRLSFSSTPHPIPEIRLLNTGTSEDWYIPEFSNESKTIDYWIKDSTIYQLDTLSLEVNYLKSDSLNQLIPQTDTLSLSYRGRKKESEKKKKGEEERIDFLTIETSARSSFEVYDTLNFVFSEPLLNFDKKLIKIAEKIDTNWVNQDLPILQDSLNPRKYWVNKKWTYEKEYKIEIDSATFTSLYGKWNDKFQTTFKVKSKDDYGHLIVSVSGNNGLPGIGEILDSSDKVLKKSVLKNGYLFFPNMKPGQYYLRYFDDTNNNEVWDTGNYEQKIQPENVYYYPTAIEIRQNWEHRQNWNIKELPVENQKPIDVNKNKPQEKKKKNENLNNQSNRK